MTGLERFARATTRAPAAAADPAGPLGRFVRPRPTPRPGEACELCSEPLGAAHGHLVDVQARSLACVCRPCRLLFDRPDAVGGRYQAVPDRYLRLDPFVLDPLGWAALSIPVGMVFFLRDTAAGRVVAFYPSPAGATESELAMDAWAGIVAANPALAELRPDVEAALVRHTAEPPECYVVPVDRCYALVGTLRTHWRGFDGGREVREHLDAFFADLRARSSVATGSRT